MHPPDANALTASQRLGRFVADCATGPLDVAVLDKAACCLLDALGLALLARGDDSVRAMAATLTALPPQAGLARAWTDGRAHILAEAVAANALAAHAQFHDDTCYASWTHPGSFVVPAAVGVGEATGSPVECVLRAIVAGYGTVAWLGADERVALALIGRGVRTSPTLGTIAAAASAAVLLGLDATRAGHAIAMATSITGGLLEPVRTGSDEWRLQNAQAARGGALAAQLAAQGLQGAATAFEGPKGLLTAYAGLAEQPPAWSADPNATAILAVVAKPYATLGDNMAPVIAARLLVDDGLAPADIDRIDVTLWRPYFDYPGTRYGGPFTQVGQALASTVFAVSAMLVFGALEYDVSRDRREHAGVLSLVRRCYVQADEDCGPEVSTVTVTLKDGTRRVRRSTEAQATLLRHDPGTAVRLLIQRLESSGRTSAAADAAQRLFERHGGQGSSIATLLNALLPPATKERT